MNITKIFDALGISKWRAAWTVIRRGVPGLLSLVAEAFTNLLRKADGPRLEYYADLSDRIARFISCGIELFISDPAYKSAGMATVDGLRAFAKHVSDGEYTQAELSEDIEFIEACINLWKEAAKKESREMCVAGIAAVVALALSVAGCAAYEGGKVVDGTNLEIGLTVPGTDGTLTVNALAYTGGLKVCGNDKTYIVVSNEVAETNSYFGIVKTQRHSRMSSTISPVDCIYILTNGIPAEAKIDTERKPRR